MSKYNSVYYEIDILKLYSKIKIRHTGSNNSSFQKLVYYTDMNDFISIDFI